MAFDRREKPSVNRWGRTQEMEGYLQSFSNAQLITLYGFIYDSIVLTNILGGHAEKQDISSLEEIKTRTTVDIIGRVVLWVESTHEVGKEC